jgi:hypothetical protein
VSACDLLLELLLGSFLAFLDKTFENYGISDGITKKQRQIASNSSLPNLWKALIPFAFSKSGA